MENGVGAHLPVKVCFIITYIIFFTSMSCTVFPLFLLLVIDCGKPPAILNGNVSFTTTIFSSIATYTCGLGYRLNGSDKSFCTDKGTWTRPTPTCNSKTPIIITIMSCHQLIIFWSLFYYYCIIGITSCPDPGVPTNSRRLTIPTALSSFPIGSIVYHICTDGFDGNGSSARECMVNGEWSGEPLTCTLRNCKSWIFIRKWL